MGQLFAKVFQSIFDSSIAEDWKTRVVFQDMLVLADEKGVVDMTVESISRRTNIPIEIISAAIPKLESPDPSSRTPDHDGRRLLRLDSHRNWGWRIVNFEKYRESATKEMLRMAEAERKRVFRAKYGRAPSPRPPTQDKKEIRGENQTCPGHVPDTGLEAPLTETEKIIQDREVKRITKRLEELKDANLQWAVDEKKELNKQLNTARAKLGLTPVNQGPVYKKPQGVDRNAGTLNEGKSGNYANVG